MAVATGTLVGRAGCAEAHCAYDTLVCPCGERLAFCRNHLGEHGWAPDPAGCWRCGEFDEIVTRLGWDCESAGAAGTMVRHRLSTISTVLAGDGPEYTVGWHSGGREHFSSGGVTPDAVAALPGYLTGESMTEFRSTHTLSRHFDKFKPKPRVTKAARA